MSTNNILRSKTNPSAPQPEQEGDDQEYKKGRGAQFNTPNHFEKQSVTREFLEGIDEWEQPDVPTQYIEVFPKRIVNKVDSPDVGMWYSMNPYQGCEHGCIYCFARNSFEYWGYSAGLDFESKIMVKKNAAQLLRKFLMNPKWVPTPIMLSGNTDCYQPAERTYRITRSLLEVCYEFNQPVGMITKNAGMLRDLDILKKMADRNLVSIIVSVTTLNEPLRRAMEPRTTTGLQRIRLIRELSNAGIRAGVMLGPMIPGLNEHEMPAIIKAASEAGASFSAYTFIRLNGAIKFLFHDWLYKNFPDKAEKVWHLIESGHGGQVNDSQFGRRISGEGNIAQMVADQYRKYTKKFDLNHERTELDASRFVRPGEQGTLF
jgi:DNA repair photolyase